MHALWCRLQFTKCLIDQHRIVFLPYTELAENPWIGKQAFTGVYLRCPCSHIHQLCQMSKAHFRLTHRLKFCKTISSPRNEIGYSHQTPEVTMLLGFAYPSMPSSPIFGGRTGRLGSRITVRWTPWNHLCSNSSFLATFWLPAQNSYCTRPSFHPLPS